jgi:hypothetical protein
VWTSRSAKIEFFASTQRRVRRLSPLTVRQILVRSPVVFAVVIALLRPTVGRPTLMYIREYLVASTTVYVRSEILVMYRPWSGDVRKDVTSAS